MAGAFSSAFSSAFDTGDGGLTHTTDALLKATTTRTHTTNTVLHTTVDQSHTTDALLFIPAPSISHTTDAVLLGATTRTHTTDTRLAIPLVRPFPLPLSVTTTTDGTPTSNDFIVNVGPTANGDRLLAMIVGRNHPTFSTPSGWTLLEQRSQFTTLTVAWFYRDTDGSDSNSTVTFPSDATLQRVGHVMRLEAGSFNPSVTPLIAGTNNNTGFPDAPNLNTAGAFDYLAITSVGHGAAVQVTNQTIWPTNYPQGVTRRSSTSGSPCTASLTWKVIGTAESSEDPAIWNTTSTSWVAHTILIQGASPHSDPYAVSLTRGFGTANTATYITATSITPPADRPVLAAVYSAILAANPNTPTLSGAGLTWTHIVSVTANLHKVSLFVGTGTPSAGTVTMTFGGQTQQRAAWSFIYLENFGNASPIVLQTKTNSSGSGTSASATLDNPLSDDSLALYAIGAATNPSSLPNSLSSLFTPPEGWYELADQATGTEAGNFGTGWSSDTNTATVDIGVSTQWVFILAELARGSVLRTLTHTTDANVGDFTTEERTHTTDVFLSIIINAATTQMIIAISISGSEDSETITDPGESGEVINNPPSLSIVRSNTGNIQRRKEVLKRRIIPR